VAVAREMTGLKDNGRIWVQWLFRQGFHSNQLSIIAFDADLSFLVPLVGSLVGALVASFFVALVGVVDGAVDVDGVVDIDGGTATIIWSYLSTVIVFSLT
jgi:hypothetical protein